MSGARAVAVAMAAAVLAAAASGCLCGGPTNTAAPYTGEVVVRPEPKPEAEWLGCTADADCVTSRDGCCGCSGGGKALAIAKKNFDDYDGLLEMECGMSPCSAVVSADPSCKLSARCEAGKCVLGTGAGTGTGAAGTGAAGTAAAGTAAGTAAAGTAGGSAAGTAAGSAAGSAAPAPSSAK